MADAVGLSQNREGNRLRHETSPYLLQHADNPVDWYPWGEEAFRKAREEDKPVFLSIGYSTCHWCHVMEHESFEDPQVARLMNEAFVSVKVDREERPDIDGVYMTVCHLMTGTGGWPLTIIMTPDKVPFFAATYIPKTARFGSAGLLDLIPRVRDLWLNRREEISRTTARVAAAAEEMSRTPPAGQLDGAVIVEARQQLEQKFDSSYGGFGGAPKFPSPHSLLFLLRQWKQTGEKRYLHMVETTLQAMRAGGIYDHLGFGFHRYSTDRAWVLPHFEKMLYDQALLMLAYVEAFQATGKPRYRETIEEIATYVLRDMTSPEGGFYSAEDADSEGEEGRFYVWETDEIGRILTPKEAALAMAYFNVQEDGNFIDQAGGQKTGTNVLYATRTIDEVARQVDLPVEEARAVLESARTKLYQARRERIHPLKDDKILTDWNGLMIAGLAKAGRVLGRLDYVEAAGRAARFSLDRMRRPDGSLSHAYRNGKAGIVANLDDYAFLVWGLIELYESGFDTGHLMAALEINRKMTELFRDQEVGGLYFTPEGGEDLLVRRKEIHDGAIPSGNSVAMLNLLRLGRMTGREDLVELAGTIAEDFAHRVRQAPIGHTHLLTALDFALGPTYEVVIAGSPDDEDTGAMLRALRSEFVPNKVVIFRPNGKSPPVAEIVPFVANQTSLDGCATAYVCSNHACESPTTNIDRMLDLLGAREG